MFLNNLGRELLRRWYFVLAGIILTASCGIFAWTAVPPTYQATSTAVLLPPTSLVGETGNPYLFMGGLDQVLTVLTVRLSSTEVAEPLIHGRGNLSYAVEKDPNSPGPIMLITTQGDSKDSAMQLLDDVARVVPENLIVLQDQLRIPTYSRVGLMTIVRDETPVRLIKDQLRLVLGVVALGLTITVLATALLDRIMTSTTPKRRAGNRGWRSKSSLRLTRPAKSPGEKSEPDTSTDSRGDEGAEPAHAGDEVISNQGEHHLPVKTSNE